MSEDNRDCSDNYTRAYKITNSALHFTIITGFFVGTSYCVNSSYASEIDSGKNKSIERKLEDSEIRDYTLR